MDEYQYWICRISAISSAATKPHKKMMEYASGASDPQIKQFFQKSAQSAMQNKQQLMQFFH